jgi:hypothetical protein
MSGRVVAVCAMAIAMGVCSTVGRFTVKDYTSKSGDRVLAGQAVPKAEYQCEQLAQDSAPWGVAGNMNRAGATEKLTATAVDSAPSKGANYVYVMIPGTASIGGFNVNAFKDAKVAYYKCANLPPSAS